MKGRWQVGQILEGNSSNMGGRSLDMKLGVSL